MRNVLKKAYIGLVLFFLYAPAVVILIQSVNASRYRGYWEGFTTQWYVSLFEDEGILLAFRNSMVIGLLSAGIATLIALLACLALVQMRRKTRSLWIGLSNIPLLNADIVTGISFMLLFLSFGLRFGFGSVLLAHITFNIPYAMLCILPRLNSFNHSFFEAAIDLGASTRQAFFSVVLPDLMPGLLAGFLLAFTMSLDDFVVTHFTKGSGFDTLPTKIYAELKLGIHPEMYALFTIFFAAILLLVILLRKNIRTTASLNRNNRRAMGAASLRRDTRKA